MGGAEDKPRFAVGWLQILLQEQGPTPTPLPPPPPRREQRLSPNVCGLLWPSELQSTVQEAWGGLGMKH